MHRVCKLELCDELPKMNPDKVKELLAGERMRLNFVAAFYRRQVAKGKHHLHEHPATALSWKEDVMEALVSSRQLRGGVGGPFLFFPHLKRLDGFCQILSHRLLDFSEICAPRRCTCWSQIIFPFELKFGEMSPRVLSGAEDGSLTVRICCITGFCNF